MSVEGLHSSVLQAVYVLLEASDSFSGLIQWFAIAERAVYKQVLKLGGLDSRL